LHGERYETVTNTSSLLNKMKHSDVQKSMFDIQLLELVESNGITVATYRYKRSIVIQCWLGDPENDLKVCAFEFRNLADAQQVVARILKQTMENSGQN
jgi:hypothetical protein